MEIDELIEQIAGIAIFLFIVIFGVFTFKAGIRYEDALTEKTHFKASSHYTLAYWDSENTVTSAQAYADILQEDAGVTVQINGATLNEAYLQKAREHDADGIRRLLDALSETAYRKIVQFDASGNVVAINYKGD